MPTGYQWIYSLLGVCWGHGVYRWLLSYNYTDFSQWDFGDEQGNNRKQLTCDKTWLFYILFMRFEIKRKYTLGDK